MVRQRRNVKTRATILFIGLAVVYAVLAVVANVVFSGNAIVQTLLLSLGSASLGSGIAFFLIRLEQVRSTLPSIVRVFMGLTVVFVALVLLALLFSASNVFVYTLLLTTGAAIFAGSLTFFLVELA